MYRTTLIVFLALFVTLTSGVTRATDSDPATYFLQISSDLGCESMDIEVISQKDKKSQYLKFGNKAFAAITLPAGAHAFGNVVCTKNNKPQSYDMLKDTLELLYLSAGRAYFGGRSIFKNVENVDPNAAPEVLNNCTNIISRARGETSNECRDGVGVDGKAAGNKQINVYAPEVTDEEMNKIRKALNATEDQLLYLPLKYKKS